MKPYRILYNPSLWGDRFMPCVPERLTSLTSNQWERVVNNWLDFLESKSAPNNDASGH